VSEIRPDRPPAWTLHGRNVFLSASIPHDNWPQEFDALEITDAVVACVSAVLAADGRILSGGHPAITPLMLRVAQDFRPLRAPDGRALVTVYQSALYEGLIPEPTKQLQETGLGELEFIPAVPGDRAVKGQNRRSLSLMRDKMLAPKNDPAFAVFIGGMDGIRDEYDMFSRDFAERPVYAIGAPGGEARVLAYEFAETRQDPVVDRNRLLRSPQYGALMDEILADAIIRMRR
jgi:hypothetical protein